MSRTATILAAAGITAAATAVTLAAAPAGAVAPTCTAWAAMPSRVALTADQVSVNAVLTGDSACTSEPRDYGASAVLHGPAGEQDSYQLWQRFGTAQQLTFTVNVDKLGTYTMRDGDVQVYDQGEGHVPFVWQPTSLSVRNGSRFVAVHKGSTVSAKLVRFDDGSWTGWAGRTVALQEHSGSSWRTVARARTDRAGSVSIPASRQHTYRLVSGDSADTWGASRTV